MSHTQGPWTLEAIPDLEDGENIEIYDKDGFPIAKIEGEPIISNWSKRFPEMVHWSDGKEDGRTVKERSAAEILANAHLFLAAPDLLEACRAFYTQVASLVEYGDLRPMSRATFEKCLEMGATAITKAEGDHIH